MDKSQIIEKIVELSCALGGVLPGRERFEKLTGIGSGEWLGIHWARWGDALQEAGLQPNEFQGPSDKEELLKVYCNLVADLGHIPTEAETRMIARTRDNFPGHSTFRNVFGSKQGVLQAAYQYTIKQHLPDQVVSIFAAAIVKEEQSASEVSKIEAQDGFVYLMKSGMHYKIGKTNKLDRRQYQIGLELPEKIEPIHSIRTDDPSGIEAYWHNRFRDKRLNGEWFALSADDVRKFKKRKIM